MESHDRVYPEGIWHFKKESMDDHVTLFSSSQFVLLSDALLHYHFKQ